MYRVTFLLLCLSLIRDARNQFVSNDFVPVIETSQFPFNFSTENVQCNEDVKLFSNSLRNNTLWAYRMWESSAKQPLGLIEGSQYQLGNFDECLSIKEPYFSQYCLATIHIVVKVNRSEDDPFSLKYLPFEDIYQKLDYTGDPNKIQRNKLFWGLCIPASCSSEDVQNELQKYLNEEHNSYIREYKVQINQEDCQNFQIQSDYEFTVADFSFCFVAGFFVLFVVLSTVYNIFYITEKNKDIISDRSTKIILCFSAKENFHELGKPEGNNKYFRILYGAKFFLMFCLISGHTLDNMMLGSVFNFKEIEEINRTLLFMIVCRGDVVVDMFFCIGGLLNTYSFLIQTERKRFSALRAIILRYFRVVPVFAIITFFYSTVFYNVGSGPLWPRIIGSEQKYCQDNWWTNILLVNNYINVENMCILQGWYLGADFQLFVLSIPLNYLLVRNTKYSWSILISILGGSIAIPFCIIYFNEKEPVYYVFNNFFYYLRNVDNFQTIYLPAYTRLSSYMLGMILGFIYYKLKDKKLLISFVKSIIIFVPATIIAFACIFSGVVFYNPHIPYSALNSALYAALHRPAFVIAGGIVLFILSYGSIPSHPLTWFPMIPLSKLSFNAYLIHFIFQLIKPASQRVPTNFSMYSWACQSITELILSMAVAFLLYIFIENPCIKFAREILPAKCFAKTVRSESKENVVQ